MANNDSDAVLTELKKINERLNEQDARMNNIEDVVQEMLLPPFVRKMYLRINRVWQLIGAAILFLIGSVVMVNLAKKGRLFFLFAVGCLLLGLWLLLETPEKKRERLLKGSREK